MHDLDYFVELAKAYGNALITRDELQDELHSCSIDTIVHGVNAIDEDYGQDTAAAFVVAGLLSTSRGSPGLSLQHCVIRLQPCHQLSAPDRRGSASFSCAHIWRAPLRTGSRKLAETFRASGDLCP